MGNKLRVWEGRRKGEGLLLGGCVLADVLLYDQPQSWSFRRGCINCTTMFLFLSFFQGNGEN